MIDAEFNPCEGVHFVATCYDGDTELFDFRTGKHHDDTGIPLAEWALENDVLPGKVREAIEERLKAAAARIYQDQRDACDWHRHEAALDAAA